MWTHAGPAVQRADGSKTNAYARIRSTDGHDFCLTDERGEEFYGSFQTRAAAWVRDFLNHLAKVGWKVHTYTGRVYPSGTYLLESSFWDLPVQHSWERSSTAKAID